MPEPVETTTQDQQPPTTLERLEAITKRLRAGEAAQTAAKPPAPPDPATATSKNVDPNDEFAAKEARVGNVPLAKSFLRLARANKAFHHLGADKVLENPRAYLRQKNAEGVYIVSDSELEVMMQTLLAAGPGQDEQGIPNDLVRGKLLEGTQKGVFGANNNWLQKTLNDASGTGAVLIRTDIEPFLYEAYLREFPAAERIAPTPSNGIVHTYDVRTAIPTAQTLNNVGDFSGAFSNSTFVRQASSNIAIIAAPVSIALKLALAVQQSGMVSFNLQGSDNLEVMGAMTSIARKNQSLLLQGNKSTASKTLDDEEGLTDANAYDGLRAILKDASTSITKSGGDTYRALLRRAAAQIRNAGGSSRNIIALCSEGGQIAIDAELEEFYRITNGRPAGGVDLNLSANGFRLGSKELSEIVSVPADAQSAGMGYYTFNSAVVEDIDVLDVTGCKFAFLGSPTPTILELPMGYNNQLGRVFVPFLMNGLVVHIANFQRKIRIPQQTV